LAAELNTLSHVKCEFIIQLIF